jgi:hypothetical protein
MNGRRAREIRQDAEATATARDGYAPMVIRNAAGKVVATFPNRQRVEGSPRSIARKTRRQWSRNRNR